MIDDTLILQWTHEELSWTLPPVIANSNKLAYHVDYAFRF